MINQLVPHSVTVVFQLTLCHLFLTFGTKVPRFHYCLVKVLTVTDMCMISRMHVGRQKTIKLAVNSLYRHR